MSRSQYKLDLAKGQVRSAIDNRNAAKGMLGISMAITTVVFIVMFNQDFGAISVFLALVSLSVMGYYYRETRDWTAAIGKAEAEVLKYEDRLEAQRPINKEW